MVLPPHLDELNEFVVDVCSLGQEEAATWAEFMEEVELLLTAKLPMVTFGSFFLHARM